MEIFEIRYFLAAASTENLQQAAKITAVSPTALSRAIARLEEEMGLSLFHRIGRNLKLSPEGLVFQKEAQRLVSQAEDLQFQMRPTKKAVPISICATEFGLSAFLTDVIRKLKNRKIEFILDVKTLKNTKEVEEAVLNGRTQLGIISGRNYSKLLTGQLLGKLKSRTLVGPGHPLYATAKREKTITIADVLDFEFVSFPQSIYGGSLAYSGSGDSWRDDQFPRKIGLKTESIEAALRLIKSGYYLGYLPDMLANEEVLALSITGCPYSSITDSYLIAQNPKDLHWMRLLFANPE